MLGLPVIAIVIRSMAVLDQGWIPLNNKFIWISSTLSQDPLTCFFKGFQLQLMVLINRWALFTYVSFLSQCGF